MNSGRGLEAWFERDEEDDADAKSVDEQTAANNLGLFIAGGPLAYAYKLFKIELHIGRATPATPTEQVSTQSSTGGEHSINGKPFDAELQFHFYNSQLVSSARGALALASRTPVGGGSLFASVAIAIVAQEQHKYTNKTKPSQSDATDADLSDSNDIDIEPLSDENQAHHQTVAGDTLLGFLLNNLRKLQRRGETLRAHISSNALAELVAHAQSEYVAYQGSQTRPPCAEAVDWLVANKPLPVSAVRLRQLFVKIHLNQDNVRPLRPLNNRQLRLRFEQASSGKSTQVKSTTKNTNWRFVASQRCEFKATATSNANNK